MTWQIERTMTGPQYSWYIRRLGMSQAAAGRYLGVSERTSRRYARGEGEIPATAALLLRALYFHGEAPLVPKWSREAN